MKKRPTAEFLAWLVPARAKIQDSLLILHKICLYYEAHQEKLDSNECAIFRKLLGAGFSLWRAVFQAHTDLVLPTNFSAAMEFLETLVHDNAVLYATEKNSWSFGYYLNNAKYRLREIHLRFREPFRSEIAEAVERLSTDVREHSSTRGSTHWEETYQVFDRMTVDLHNTLNIS